MLITESQMGFMNSRYGMNAINLLDNMHYLSEAESVYSPALVPVIENKNIGAHLIRLEDMVSFAESNGIEDLGYALTCVCESSEVDPSTIVFTVQEENLIADDGLAALTSAIMNEGVGVVAKPLNINDSMGIMMNIAINHLLETGDDFYLDALKYGDYQLLTEKVSLEREKPKVGSKASQFANSIRQAKFVRNELADRLQNDGSLSFDDKKRMKQQIENIDRQIDKQIRGHEELLRMGVDRQSAAGHIIDGKDPFDLSTKKDILKELNIQRHNREMKEEQDRIEKSLTFNTDHKNETSDEEGNVPSDAAVDNIKKKAMFADSRNAIAKLIAKAHAWASKINKEIQDETDPNKKGFFRKVLQKITAVIQYLTAKMHNFVKTSDKEALADKYNKS